jgi:hypothetical protein
MNVSRTRAGGTGRVDLCCTNTTTKCNGRRLMSVSVAEVVTVMLLVVSCYCRLNLGRMPHLSSKGLQVVRNLSQPVIKMSICAPTDSALMDNSD